MSDTLIINARQQLPWQLRLVSDTSTAVLWGWWLWLCRPVLGLVNWLGTLGSGMSLPMTKLIVIGSSTTLEPFAALVGTSGTLMLWNLLPAPPSPATKTPGIREYAAHFGLPEAQVLSGQSASVCVVHHGDSGQITHIEQRA